MDRYRPLVKLVKLVMLVMPLWIACLLTPSCSNAPGPTHDNTNILLITLDTTRGDYLGIYGKYPIKTPALDALATEGSWFSRATASVPMTLPAHTTLFTGTYPIDHGVRDNSGFFAQDELVTLAEVLQDHGWSTHAVVAAFVLDHGWGLDQGFETYDDEIQVVNRRVTTSLEIQRRADAVVDQAIAWWDQFNGERWFSWLHFYDPHFPYDPPEPFATQYAENPYAGEVAFTDAQVARVMSYLKQTDQYDDTLIVVIGDHGEALGQHGEPDHGIFVYESTMHIPLILRFPEVLSGAVAPSVGRIDDFVRDVDIMPTILDALGLPIPSPVRGQSLLPILRGERSAPEPYAYAETFYSRYHYGWSELQALRDSKYKFIRAPQPELYDLEQDPGETTNLIGQAPDIAQALHQELDALLADAQRVDSEPEAMDPETLARLQALGYVGSTVRVSETSELPDPKDRVASLKLFQRIGFQGSRHLREGRYAKVIAMVDEALAAEPNYLDGYHMKGQALRKMGRFNDAVDVLEQALKLNPDHITTLHELAESHRGRGDLQIALDLAERIQAAAPTYAGAYLTRADTFVAQGQFDTAIAELEKLAQVQPDAALPRYEIGRVLLRQGKLDAGREAIQQALAIRPRLFGAHYNLALIAEQANDFELALKEYALEVEEFPKHYEAWANRGLLQAAQNMPVEAEASFQKLIELRPQHYLGHMLLARTYLLQRRPASQTLELARRAVKLAPDSRPARQLLQEAESLYR